MKIRKPWIFMLIYGGNQDPVRASDAWNRKCEKKN